MRVIVWLMLMMSVAYALDPDGRYAQSPLKDWFKGLKSESGNACCADADGALVDDADWTTADGHYRVRIKDQWIDVPDDAVVKGANLYGKTVVWGYRSGDTYVIRCFMPGVMM